MTNPSTQIKEAFKTIPTVCILIFRTNIRYKKDIRMVASILNEHASVTEWNIDLMDVDKVLRIKSTCDNSKEIIFMIRQAGYFCEELPG